MKTLRFPLFLEEAAAFSFYSVCCSPPINRGRPISETLHSEKLYYNTFAFISFLGGIR